MVGAGFAGLAAADALASAGVDVVVLEARDRVGGRVWSRELENGAVVEMGAEFILPGNNTLLSYVDRFGLELWGKDMLYGDRDPRGGIGVEPGSMQRAIAEIDEALQDIEPGRSAAELLDSLPLDPGAAEAIRSRLEVSSAATAERVEATALSGLAAHSADICPSIAGGNQRVALALAAELGSAIHLSSPVDRISWNGDAVIVTAAGSETPVDRVVLAVPASVLDGIEFDPPLPGSLRAAYAAVGYGNAAKLFVPLAERPPPSAVLSVPERYWTWTATGADGVQPVVNAFAGSAPALARLQVTEGPGTWLASLGQLRPDLALLPDDAVFKNWDADPWVRAAYSSERPSTSAWAPAGPFHACGEHTCDGNAALMDGALASGRRVAQEILDAD
ncbi:flavin monoamine oxidase family protein [Gaiella sp.]|uniref:flavin monoamine oxidase family protein n=1 Tax=Gaiella sp. TaxID=2663207 RepID=UPI0039837A6A